MNSRRLIRSLAPDVPDTLIGHRGVHNGIRDRAVTHEGLQRSCLNPSARQGVTSGMAQHVRMDREGQLSGHAKPFNQLLGAVDGQGSLALGQEHEVSVRVLAP